MTNIPRNETKYYQELQSFINNSKSEPWKMIMTFPKYIDRQHLSVFLARYEIFKKIINIHGSIVECGAWSGNGLMTWAQCCAIMEPYNYIRKIIGFDTFKGLPEFHNKELNKAIELYDQNKPIGHIQKVELVRGDAVKTIPEYIKKNPHLVVSLLHIDFDLCEPTMDLYKSTKAAIEYLIPRIPKGGIIVFDDLNDSRWPDETIALVETLGIQSLKLQKTQLTPKMSYALIE